MASAARRAQADPTLLHLVGDETDARLSRKIDCEELQRTLDLVRLSIKTEREKVAQLQQRIVELEGFEQAYVAERQFAHDLKADRDCWRGQAMMMMNYMPKR